MIKSTTYLGYMHNKRTVCPSGHLYCCLPLHELQQHDMFKQWNWGHQGRGISSIFSCLNTCRGNSRQSRWFLHQTTRFRLLHEQCEQNKKKFRIKRRLSLFSISLNISIKSGFLKIAVFSALRPTPCTGRPWEYVSWPLKSISLW